MKRIIQSIFLSTLTLGAFGQSSKDAIILEVKDEKVPVKDFKYVYNKNNSKDKEAYSQKSLNEYMDLFVKYKLKVKEAETLKMDTAIAFIEELEGYRVQLAKPYLTAPGFEEKMAKEAYQRMKMDVSTSHILIMVDEFAAPEDTLITYNKALDIRKKILAGADFGQMAIEFSEDPSAKEAKYTKGYKGYLGFNPAFSFVYPYETASYNTNVGAISMPVRTKFGYHVIKVNEKRANQGEIKVAHIMIEARDGIAASDSIEKLNIVTAIKKELDGGKDWDKTCAEYSTDKRTSDKGGVMQVFAMDGKLGVPSFEKAAFELKNVGEISEPVKSPYGWHIIKLIQKIPLKSYEDIKPELLKQVKRSDRFNLNRPALIQKLKQENNFKQSKKALRTINQYADSTLITGDWKIPTSFKANKKLFKINREKYTLGEYFDYLADNQAASKSKSPSYAMESAFNEYVDNTVYSYQEEHLLEKYEDYRMLLKEYRDGILLFDLMQTNVWDKAAKDTAGLRAFYQTHQENYQKPVEIKAITYRANDQAMIAQIQQAVAAGKTPDEINKAFNQESALTIKVDQGIYEEGKNEVLEGLDTSIQNHTLLKDDYHYYVVIQEVIPAGIKPLKKCRGLVISDYQEQLEKEWVAELKAKYPVKINQAVLKSLVK